ncbi:MAG: MBL fold metallo-hydrolase [Candidatus Solibacter usitatus]|nr:MBL fold metallo-hydrolase [Candidatus Solibacter usitatus]
MSLMEEIRAFPVPRNAVGLWWLGQNGYIFKTHEGTLLATDLYLSNRCAHLYCDSGLCLERRVPILIPPEELDVDIYACTHNHADHTDPDTIGNLRHKDTTQFIGPHPSCAVYAAEGVESGRIVPAWPSCALEFRDIAIHGTFALPTDDTDLNHMGYVFQFGKGPRVYMTGDTDYTDLLASAAKHEPDLVITCINGGFNNLSHWEAAQLVGKIGPKAAIPCHYDMFPDNAVDPGQFRASLKLRAPEVRYQELRHGHPFVFEL